MNYDVLTIEDWIRRVYAAQLGPAVAQRLWMEPYSYGITFTAFNGVSGNTTGTLQINSNADFVLLRLNYEATLGTVQTVSSKPVCQARVQITDQGSGLSFFNQGVPLEAVTGHSYTNKAAPYPRFLTANTSLGVSLVAYGTAAETFSAVDVVLEGVRVRQYSAGLASSAMAPTQQG